MPDSVLESCTQLEASAIKVRCLSAICDIPQRRDAAFATSRRCISFYGYTSPILYFFETKVLCYTKRAELKRLLLRRLGFYVWATVIGLPLGSSKNLSPWPERVIFCLEDESEPPTVHTIVEMRGKKEDKNLLAYYTQMLDTGTYWVTSERFKSHLRQFDFIPQKANFIGLQVADLVAYPVTRHILNPSELNPAYDAIKHNIYSKDGKQLGLIIFPKEH